jgi:hypothetical protein
VLELSYEVKPRENVTPPVRTEVLLTHDRSNFYIGFRCFDPDPSQIRAHLSDRDSFGGDDWVAVEIDTYNDSRRAFTLFSTALGVQGDGISDAAGIKDYTWDMIYDSAGQTFAWGYGVEMAIPFSSLRFQRTEGSQVWGMNIVRGYPRNVSYQIWAQPYDRSNNCRVCQYLRIEGFEGVSPGRNIEIDPTLTGTTTDERDPFPGGELANRNRASEAGLTARWGITPNLMLSGTLNPDFSQVEADSAQLDINQPFALFHPERRPFFTEGLDFFETPLEVVYTRTIRDPGWGLKLSGKEGAHGVGGYVVEDEVTNLIFPGGQQSSVTSLARQSTAAVLRYGRDVGSSSTLGVLLTNRDGGEYFNRVYGLDGSLRLSQSDQVVFQLLGSSTRYDAATSEAFGQPEGEFRDEAVSATYVRKTRYHEAELGYLDIGEGFRADLGFLPQVGFRRLRARSSHDWIPKGDSWWSRFGLVNVARYTSDSEGRLLERALDNSFGYSGTYQTSLRLGNTISRRRHNGTEFDLTRFEVSAGITPTGDWSFSVSSSFGDGIDFVNTRKGKRTVLSPNLTYSVGKHLRLNLSHSYEGMTVDGDRLYTANISQGSIVVFLNARTFVRSLLQYFDYEYNTASYQSPVEPESRQFFTQLLFSYKVNPRAVLFLGYTDDHFGGADHGITRKDRTLFVKIGYAWVL